MENKRVIHEVALFVCPYFGFVYCIQYVNLFGTHI